MSTETTAPMTAVSHHHLFPCQPPRGSLTAPGDCSCGMTYARNKALSMLDAAVRAILVTEPGAVTGMPGPGIAHRLDEQWGVAWGSGDLNDGRGYAVLYGDEEDARDHMRLYPAAAAVVRRMVIMLPWVAVPQEAAMREGR